MTANLLVLTVAAFAILLFVIGMTAWARNLERQQRLEAAEEQRVALLKAEARAAAAAKVKADREAEAFARREHEELEKKRQQEERQLEIATAMTALANGSVKQFELLPSFISDAEAELDAAEAEFGDHAFGPFWDRIERSANLLARFDEAVRHISSCSSKYSELVPKYAGVTPPFAPSPDSVEKLKIATHTTQRLRHVVRQAQRDFQFSVIFEQRKTNQLLVAGFTTLNQAIERMTEQVTSSLDRVSDDITTLGHTIDYSSQVVADQISETGAAIGSRIDESRRSMENRVEGLIEQHRSSSNEQRRREIRVIEMLDNIQRGRRPGVFD